MLCRGRVSCRAFLVWVCVRACIPENEHLHAAKAKKYTLHFKQARGPQLWSTSGGAFVLLAKDHTSPTCHVTYMLFCGSKHQSPSSHTTRVATGRDQTMPGPDAIDNETHIHHISPLTIHYINIFFAAAGDISAALLPLPLHLAPPREAPAGGIWHSLPACAAARNGLPRGQLVCVSVCVHVCVAFQPAVRGRLESGSRS